MRTFTKLIVIALFVVCHLAGYTVMAYGAMREGGIGVLPTNTGGVSALKVVTDKHADTIARPEPSKSKSWVKGYAKELSITQAAYASSSTLVINSYTAFMPMAERQLPSINAYPNPSRGITRVSLSQVGLAENYKLKISNTIGKVMETHELPVTHSNVFILDMTGYPAGVYFYSLLVNDKTVETKRLILQK